MGAAITFNREDQPEKQTIMYKGEKYNILVDMHGRCFIQINSRKRLYLDKTGQIAKKQKGSRTVTTAIESFEDMKKIQDYFIEHEKWNFYLLFTLNVNTGRRISDLLHSRWSDFFYKNGNMREYWNVMKVDDDGEIIDGEQKTGKKKAVYLNDAVREAFSIFFEHETSIDLEKDCDEFVFKQLHGNYKGRVLSQEIYRKNLIKASECLDYEIRSHSMRRGMGYAMLEMHPNDPKAKSVLMEIFNHSSEKMTNKYIGETKKHEKEYFSDLGENYVKYVMHGEKVPFNVRKPVSYYDNSELRQYMMIAFAKILDAKDETDPIALMSLYNELLDGLEKIAK